MSFDAKTFEIWGSLLNGCSLVLIASSLQSLEEIEQKIKQNNVSIIWLTSALLNLIVDKKITILKSIKKLLAGGDILSTHHINKVRNYLPNCQIINGYGPTENTTFTCCYTLDKDKNIDYNVIPIGKPINNTQIFILDINLQPLPVGITGELHIGGDGLARGYLNRPELTAEKFIDNPFGEGKLYKTGDLCRYLPDGNIEFILS